MDMMGGSGKVAVLVTAETKQALKQLRDVNKQTKNTAKTSQNLSKSMSAGTKKFGIVAVAALTVVTGGFYAMLRASSYAEVYTKRWQSEQTLIANEWVRRHMGTFDRITEMYVDVRKSYLGKKGFGLREAMGIGVAGTEDPLLQLRAREAAIQQAGGGKKLIWKETIAPLVRLQKAMSEKVSEGNKRLIDYATLWVNTYIRPILDFIKSIFNKVTEIVALIPGLGINIEYNIFNGGGGGGGDGENGDDGGDDGQNPPPIAPTSIRALGAI
ncbi:MAG: hypothetical protein ACT6FG_00160 [Methanosarcinaceae archaeon]